MSFRWSDPDLVFLKQQLEHGRVALFAGAGFSLGAYNQNNQPLPLGRELARLLAEKAGMPFQDETLSMVYEAVEPRIGTSRIWDYLSELYAVVEKEDWYKIVTSITWSRIYTTNIDDLFQRLHPFSSGQKLRNIVRGDAPDERDPHFEKLQCIHLHGHIDYRSNGLTFTLPDFATHTANIDPWYQALVEDLDLYSFIFIGTTLEEPILSHYIKLREKKERDGKHEFRPKSFLIAPKITPIWSSALKQRNILPIESSAKNFFGSLNNEVGLESFAVSRVQEAVWPHLFASDKKVELSLAVDFDPIVVDSLPPVRPSGGNFFLGSEPTWDDIKEGRDANRDINDELVFQIENADSGFKCFVLHGPAGSGKTTSIMRVAVRLAGLSDYAVYFARGINRLSLDNIISLAKSMSQENKRILVVIDVISRHIGTVHAKHKELLEQKNLTLLLADRTNRYASRCQQLAALEPIEMSMPDLTKSDVEEILDKLQKFKFLGALRKLSRDEQINEFMIRAKRQLLIAMREATSGKEFDSILQSEFGELIPDAQLLYTICCIAVSKGSPGVYRKHLSPCIPKTNFTKGVVIDDLLRGVLVPGNETGTLLKPRHGVIAYLVANEIAPIELRYKAVEKFLTYVSKHIVPNQIRKRTPPFLAYRGMVNSDGLFDLLSGSSEDVLALYDEVRDYYDGDFLFWLQYAMANIQAGNLDTAENYLNQSLSLNPAERNHQAQHQRGILYLLQSIEVDNPTIAKDKAKEGMDILRQQIEGRGDHDSYPYHAYLIYVARWYIYAKNFITQKEWESLRNIAKEAHQKYPLDDKIRDAVKEVERLYLTRLIPEDMSQDGDAASFSA